MKKKIAKFKPVPLFADEAAERRFWKNHSSTDYIDWTQARHVRFMKLKPVTKSKSQTATPAAPAR